MRWTTLQDPVCGVRGIDPDRAWSCHRCSHGLDGLVRVSDIKGDDYSTALSARILTTPGYCFTSFSIVADRTLPLEHYAAIIALTDHYGSPKAYNF